MKKLKLIVTLFIGITFLNCSSDDSSNSNATNGFTANGVFYETEFAFASCCSPYILIFSSYDFLSPNRSGHFGRFDLRTGSNIPLSEGTYSINNGIEDLIQFKKDVDIVDGNPISGGENIAYTGYSGQGVNGFQSGSVNINSVSSDANNQITEIDINYEFQWEGIRVFGSYSGFVTPN